MTVLEILADTRLQLRGTADPIPDPLPAAKAKRRTADALARLDAGEHIFVGGLGIRAGEGGYMAGPLGPMDRAELEEMIADLVTPL